MKAKAEGEAARRTAWAELIAALSFCTTSVYASVIFLERLAEADGDTASLCVTHLFWIHGLVWEGKPFPVCYSYLPLYLQLLLEINLQTFHIRHFLFILYAATTLSYPPDYDHILSYDIIVKAL